MAQNTKKSLWRDTFLRTGSSSRSTMRVYFQQVYIYLFIHGAAGFLSCSHTSTLSKTSSPFLSPRMPSLFSITHHLFIHSIHMQTSVTYLIEVHLNGRSPGNNFRCQAGSAPHQHEDVSARWDSGGMCPRPTFKSQQKFISEKQSERWLICRVKVIILQGVKKTEILIFLCLTKMLLFHCQAHVSGEMNMKTCWIHFEPQSFLNLQEIKTKKIIKIHFILFI